MERSNFVVIFAALFVRYVPIKTDILVVIRLTFCNIYR